MGCLDSDAFSTLAERDCLIVRAAFFTAGTLAGSMADRFHRHHILLITQTIGCVFAALTAFLSFSDHLNPYNLAVLALIFGIVTSIDGPSMHSMLVETGETVSQAVARQSLVMNVARSIAPMLAVFIIESFSATWCFAMNAICFIPMIAVMAVVKIPNRTTSEEREESVGVTSRQLFMTYPIHRETPGSRKTFNNENRQHRCNGACHVHHQ